MTPQTVLVSAKWDGEAQVFVATSENVPGLVAEAATIDDLEAKLAVLIPELLALNGEHSSDSVGHEVPMILTSQRTSKVRVYS